MSGLCATQKDKIRKNRPFVHTQNNKTDVIIPFVETQMPFLKNFRASDAYNGRSAEKEECL